MELAVNLPRHFKLPKWHPIHLDSTLTTSKCTGQNVCPTYPRRQSCLALHLFIVALVEEHMSPWRIHTARNLRLVVNQKVTLYMGLVSGDDQPEPKDDMISILYMNLTRFMPHIFQHTSHACSDVHYGYNKRLSSYLVVRFFWFP